MRRCCNVQRRPFGEGHRQKSFCGASAPTIVEGEVENEAGARGARASACCTLRRLREATVAWGRGAAGRKYAARIGKGHVCAVIFVWWSTFLGCLGRMKYLIAGQQQPASGGDKVSERFRCTMKARRGMIGRGAAPTLGGMTTLCPLRKLTEAAGMTSGPAPKSAWDLDADRGATFLRMFGSVGSSAEAD